MNLVVTLRRMATESFSGTTGKPKGVDVTHKNVTNLVCLSPGGLGVQPGMSVGQVLNISFDMGTFCCLLVVAG